MAIDAIGAIGTEPSAPLQPYGPGPVLDDTSGATPPRPSDYNAQSAQGLAFSSPAFIAILAASTAGLTATLPAVAPVDRLTPVARTGVYVDPYFVDTYR